MLLSDFEAKIVQLVREEKNSAEDLLNRHKQLVQLLQFENDRLRRDNQSLRCIVDACTKCRNELNSVTKSRSSPLKAENPNLILLNPQKREIHGVIMTQYSDDDDSGTVILSSPVKPVDPPHNPPKFSPFKLPSVTMNEEPHSPLADFKIKSEEGHERRVANDLVHPHIPEEDDSNADDDLDLVKAGSDSQRSEVRLLESEFGSRKFNEYCHVKAESDSQEKREILRHDGRQAVDPLSPDVLKRRRLNTCNQLSKTESVSKMRLSSFHGHSPKIELFEKQIGKSPIPNMGPELQEDDCGIVEDLEGEEPINKSFTGLQKRQNARRRLVSALHLSTSSINLNKNPVTDSTWVISDFKRNPNYTASKRARASTGAQGPGGASKRRIAMTKDEEANQQRFYRIANGYLNDETSQKEFGENDPDAADFENVWSQLHEKLPSPPGFMQSDFPDTQETNRRRTLVVARQQRRIQRRIGQCLIKNMGTQCGEFIFSEDVLNAYVLAERYIR